MICSATATANARALQKLGGIRGLAARPSRSPARCMATAQDATAEAAAPPVAWVQRTLSLPQHRRGCHIITEKIYEAAPEIAQFEVGLANIFIMHTSASLTINENASPDVLLDLNDALDRIAPEGKHYRHDDEGPDDMPAHVKSSVMGASLTVPIAKGRLALGTWQGIYLNEHRDRGGSRTIMLTIQGQRRPDGRAYGRHR
ncbi:secondary thiamine-phosphate synthase enzyme [Raphidocelis subcapitata]|uniref:Secondary thiamine-phosphate synthase enzyme n=1 Tax=Raphidocelis subcapitata TaxID=307507 RepID=A0A2V0PG86_9CHLO|nr:secondary thiamine-phosphate synthase enzyme [Raphidocelis subcapitata]|eukprot:GBF96217.1 secondary thiamine-phosphate synthase enzyme [Raphidocelis subcapitata]